jgi:hypothetical protein
MELVGIALSLFMQHPDLVSQGTKQLNKPGVVDVQKMQASFADFSKGVLHCYHRTARFQVADVVEKPWARQGQYGAQSSAVIHIRYFGVTGSPYQMLVAVLAKDQQVRTEVLQDTAKIPRSKDCQLEQWSS